MRRGGSTAGMLLLSGLVIGASLWLTVIRHELLHVLGALITGGTVTRIAWLPAAGTVGAVEITPPLTAGPAAFYLPLMLPYIGDFALIGLGLLAVGRLDMSTPARRAAAQHAVEFAGLDVVVNCAAAFLGPNDWDIILGGWGAWRLPFLAALIVACVWAVAVERCSLRRAGPPTERAWLAPPPMQGAGGQA